MKITHRVLQWMQDCRPWRGGGDAMAPQGFGRSVNPISTNGDRLFPPNSNGTPGFSDIPTALECRTFSLQTWHWIFPVSFEITRLQNKPKVSKSRKQIIVSSILPKLNKKNLTWGIRMLLGRFFCFVLFFRSFFVIIYDAIYCFRDFLTFRHCEKLTDWITKCLQLLAFHQDWRY